MFDFWIVCCSFDMWRLLVFSVSKGFCGSFCAKGIDQCFFSCWHGIPLGRWCVKMFCGLVSGYSECSGLCLSVAVLSGQPLAYCCEQPAPRACFLFFSTFLVVIPHDFLQENTFGLSLWFFHPKFPNLFSNILWVPELHDEVCHPLEESIKFIISNAFCYR